MKKRTFTPGPWVAHGTAIHAESGAVGGATMMNKNAAANAALMAMAPAMAELLAECLPQVTADKKARISSILNRIGL